MNNALLYTLFPAVSIMLGTLFTIIVKPKGLLINIIQAFSAGVLLAGIATELLPRLDFSHYSLSLALAFFIGLLLMFCLSQLNPGCCSSKSNKPLAPFVTAFALEFFINGIVIALSATVSLFAGFLVGLSMALCCFVCGTTVATRFHELKFHYMAYFGYMILLALLPLLGGLLCLLILHHIPTVFIDAVLAFGVGVLLYIACIDLLFGALKNNNSLIKLAFFLGFIVIPIVGANI